MSLSLKHVTTGSPSASFGRHIPALDGLRGLAALLVAFHHSFIWPMLFSKGIIDPAAFHASYGNQILPKMLWYGYSGVDLFFLLSGFCLFYPVFICPDKPYSLSKYAFHRIRRIYPPYVATLALAVGLAAFAGSKIAAHLNGVTEPVRLRSVVTALTLTESHYCATFWSLVVEAQWYFLVPVLALLWKWSRWAMHSGMLASIAAATLLSPLAPKYHLSLLQLGLLAIYLPLFWLGIVLAEIAAGYGQWARTFLQRGGWLIVLLTGYVAIHHYAPPEAVWGQSRAQAFPFGLFYSGILAAALFTGAGQRLFSSSLAVKAGAFSYSLYLIHGLIVYIAIVAMAHYHIDGWRELVICLSVLPAVCIASGYLFYLAVEKRTLRARASNESFVRTAAQPKEFAPVV